MEGLPGAGHLEAFLRHLAGLGFADKPAYGALAAHLRAALAEAADAGALTRRVWPWYPATPALRATVLGSVPPGSAGEVEAAAAAAVAAAAAREQAAAAAVAAAAAAEEEEQRAARKGAPEQHAAAAKGRAPGRLI